MKTQKITNLQQPQSLQGLSTDRNQNLTLTSVTLNDGKEVPVNAQFTPSMEGRDESDLVANFNHDGKDYQFVVDSNHQIQARGLSSDSAISGITVGIG